MPAPRHRSAVPGFVVAALIATALSAAACTEIGEPYLGEGVRSPSTTVEPEDVIDAPEEQVVSANVSAVFSPPRPEGYTALVLASLGDALVTVDGTTITELGDRFPGAPTERVVDDFLGGLVAELQGDIIQWLPADGSTPTLVSQSSGSLLDTGFVDDTLAVQVFLEVAGGIDQVKLVDGEREPFTRLGEEASVVAFSSSNGIQAVAIRDDRCGTLAFFNTSGQRVDLGGPADPECPVPRRPRFGGVAMSPGGDVVAYTEVTYRDDGLPASTQLTVLELESGTALLVEPVGAPGEQIESLAFDGRRVVFLRTGEVGRQVGLVDVVDRAESALEGLAGVRDVSFARLPLLLAAPEEEAPDADPDAGAEPEAN